jgi:HSP20 family protein
MKALKIQNGKGLANGGSPPAPWNEFFGPPMPGLFRDQAAWLDRWFRGAGFPGVPAFNAPAVDVSEDEKEVTIKAEIPGLTDKDLQLTFANGMLQLKGEKKGEREERKKNTWHRETWQGSFTRTIPLGDRVEWKQAQARHKDGILTVIIPKKKGATQSPVKIDIQ